MQLRNHPLMTRKSGMKSWPPHWVSTRNVNDKPRGEIGILQRVTAHPTIGNGLFLWINHQGSEYIGSMYFDDVAFCRVIGKVLASKIGVSIREIGYIDLSFTL